MRVLIAVDMEGISGIVHWDQVDPKHPEYARFRQIMTDEVNAAIDGAMDGGAAQIVVNDGHDGSRNILIEKLHPPARLISGTPTPLSMVEGVQDTDIVFFIGYHARASTAEAVLCHTWSDEVRRVTLNGREVGEIGLNGAVCGSFGVPIALVSGDQAATSEALDLFGEIETAVVKRAIGRMAAECFPIEENHHAIRMAAARALNRRVKPFVVEPPITLRVELMRVEQIDRALRVPGSKRIDGTTIEWIGHDMPSVYSAFRAIASLAG
jgi:D-amino peptidase